MNELSEIFHNNKKQLILCRIIIFVANEGRNLDKTSHLFTRLLRFRAARQTKLYKTNYIKSFKKIQVS